MGNQERERGGNINLSTLDKSVVLITFYPKYSSSNTVNDPSYIISKLAIADHISKHKEYAPKGSHCYSSTPN